MVNIKKDIISFAYKGMSQLADVIAELNNNGLDLIHDEKKKNWLITNATQSHKYIIEESYQGVSELRKLTKKDLLFLLEE